MFCATLQHSALLDLDTETAFFGVFDGHGGKAYSQRSVLSCSVIVLNYSQGMQ
jgi:serine/threonine protein phosphatase PrpC